MESYFGNFDQESLMILPFLLMIREHGFLQELREVRYILVSGT